MDYILIIFGSSDNQQEFVETISKDVSVMSDMGEIKYYYGPDSMIVTFKCSEPLESIDAFMKLLYGKMNIVYLLLPYTKDNLSVKMDNDISKHLFDIEQKEEMSEKMSELDKMVQNLNNQVINCEEFISELEQMESEDEEDEIAQIINKNSKNTRPTLDELLDKISDRGISSLTEKELSLLNKYSNK